MLPLAPRTADLVMMRARGGADYVMRSDQSVWARWGLPDRCCSVRVPTVLQQLVRATTMELLSRKTIVVAQECGPAVQSAQSIELKGHVEKFRRTRREFCGLASNLTQLRFDIQIPTHSQQLNF